MNSLIRLELWSKMSMLFTQSFDARCPANRTWHNHAERTKAFFYARSSDCTGYASRLVYNIRDVLQGKRSLLMGIVHNDGDSVGHYGQVVVSDFIDNAWRVNNIDQFAQLTHCPAGNVLQCGTGNQLGGVLRDMFTCDEDEHVRMIVCWYFVACHDQLPIWIPPPPPPAAAQAPPGPAAANEPPPAEVERLQQQLRQQAREHAERVGRVINANTEQVQLIQGQLERVQQQRDEALEDARQLRAQLFAAQQAAAARQGDPAAAAATAALNRQLAEANAAAENAAQEVLRVQGQLRQAQQDLETAQGERDRARNAVEDQTARANEAVAARQGEETARQAAERREAAASAQVGTLTGELATARGSLQSERQLAASLRLQAANLRRLHTAAIQGRDQAVRELARERADQAAAEAAAQAAVAVGDNSELAAANERLARCRAISDAQFAQLNTLNTQLAGLTTRCQEAEGRATAAERRVGELQENITRLQGEAEAHASTLATEKQQREEAERRANTAEERCMRSEADRTQSNALVNRLETELEQARTAAAAQPAREEVPADLREANRRIETLVLVQSGIQRGYHRLSQHLLGAKVEGLKAGDTLQNLANACLEQNITPIFDFSVSRLDLSARLQDYLSYFLVIDKVFEIDCTNPSLVDHNLQHITLTDVDLQCLRRSIIISRGGSEEPDSAHFPDLTTALTWNLRNELTEFRNLFEPQYHHFFEETPGLLFCAYLYCINGDFPFTYDADSILSNYKQMDILSPKFAAVSNFMKSFSANMHVVNLLAETLSRFDLNASDTLKCLCTYRRIFLRGDDPMHDP